MAESTFDLELEGLVSNRWQGPGSSLNLEALEASFVTRADHAHPSQLTKWWE